MGDTSLMSVGISNPSSGNPSSGRRLGAAVLALGGLMLLSGCDSVGYMFGGSHPVPDEFRVLPSAPLEVPPDFNLRPPQPGSPRPQELARDTRSVTTVFGASADAAANAVAVANHQSKGEQALTKLAGADNADPRIRTLIDKEWPGSVVGDRGFLESLMFWKGDGADTTVTSSRDSSSADQSAAEQK